jgi:ribosomal protein S18 acetylase RimI-like enzyme
MSEPSFQMIADLSDEMRESILAPLREFNRSQNVDFFEARDRPENAPKPLNIVVSDSDGKMIGGLLAHTQFRWLHISIAAVQPEYRRKGIGRTLIARAEADAIARGCKHAFLDTMNYQAPGFYQGLGYEIAGKIDNWDSHGHTKIFMVKHLS